MNDEDVKEKDEAQQSSRYWLSAIKEAEESFTKFFERGRKVVERYRDERGALDERRKKFNILWSNIQILKPALYGRSPKPEVTDRFHDGDAITRCTSRILERSLLFEVEHYPDFDFAMSGSLDDRLLPGRGTVWQRYEMGETGSEDTGMVSEDISSRLAYECAPTDYVNWQDFLHNPARTWEEVWWVGRRVWMTKEEGIARFGDIFDDVPVQGAPKDQINRELPKDALKQKAQVWEIWDKTDKTVVWIAKGFDKILDMREDPLKLERFFPCPRPLYATLTTGSLIPVPDYCEYQDQAEELDSITQRIHLLTKALKAVGVYNAEFKSIKRLFNESVDNDMLPVDSWAAFAEKGGLKGAVDFIPIDTTIKVLDGLTQMREQTKMVIYEIMGIADIIRGSSNPNETLGAQQLKAQFGSMRLRATQYDVARFATEILRNKAQVMANFFSPETLVRMSGIMQTPDAPYVPKALQLLKSGSLKDFRIAIQADTLAQIDEAQERQQAGEFVASVGQLIANTVPMIEQVPATFPMLSELIMFQVRRMKPGVAVEASFEKSLQLIQQQLAQPKPPDPAIVTEQIRQQTEKIRAGSEAQRSKMELVQGQQDIVADQQKARAQAEKAATDILLAQTEAKIVPIKAAAEVAKAEAAIKAAKEPKGEK